MFVTKRDGHKDPRVSSGIMVPAPTLNCLLKILLPLCLQAMPAATPLFGQFLILFQPNLSLPLLLLRSEERREKSEATREKLLNDGRCAED